MKSFLKNISYVEGGASGHLSHIHDELDLTFGQLQDLIKKMSQGKVRTIEKVDGQNIWITYKNGVVKAARNGGDLKTDGMTLKELLQKFAGRGAVKQAFGRGMIGFIRLIKASKPMQDAFNVGEDTLWVNAEIMFSDNANILLYDGNNLVLHNAKIYDKSKGEAIETPESKKRFAIIEAETKKIKQIKGWNVFGNLAVNLKTFDPSPAINKLLAFMKQWKLTDENTLSDYLRAAVGESEYTQAFHDNETVINFLADKMTGAQVPNVNLLKKSVSPSQAKELSALNSDVMKIKKEVLTPIETLLHEVSVLALSGVHSALIQRPMEELERLKSESVKYLSSNIDETKTQKIMSQMSKIVGKNIRSIGTKNVNEVIKSLDSAIEGVVFQYDDKLLKITGNFAPLNQILGALKYAK